jgi:hypothetical protein
MVLKTICEDLEETRFRLKHPILAKIKTGIKEELKYSWGAYALCAIEILAVVLYVGLVLNKAYG